MNCGSATTPPPHIPIPLDARIATSGYADVSPPRKPPKTARTLVDRADAAGSSACSFIWVSARAESAVFARSSPPATTAISLCIEVTEISRRSVPNPLSTRLFLTCVRHMNAREACIYQPWERTDARDEGEDGREKV